jgi:hypothetical protein
MKSISIKQPSGASIYPNTSIPIACEWIVLLCTFILLVVWPLADTIALRNIALAIGAASGLTWILMIRPQVSLKMLLPVICLVFVPIWLWLHLQIFPTNYLLQLQDLQGTWVRVLLALLMASSLGLIVVRKPKYANLIWLTLAILPIGALVFYLPLALSNQELVFNFQGFFKSKIAGAYFILWPLLAAFALLHDYLTSPRSALKGIGAKVFGVGLLALLCTFDLIALRSLNGLLVATLMFLMLVGICFWHMFISGAKKPQERKWTPFVLLVVFSLMFSIFWRYDQNHEKKLVNLLKDVQIASQIDRHQSWHGNNLSRDDPQYNPADSDGRRINGSAYERTSWFLKALQFLEEHPLGAGYSHLAFGAYMGAEYPGSIVNQSHSGWLDFALGVGLPGLLLVWAAIFLCCWNSLSNVSSSGIARKYQLVTMWTLSGMFSFWCIGEVSEREFIEHFFFMIALLAVLSGSLRLKGAVEYNASL